MQTNEIIHQGLRPLASYVADVPRRDKPSLRYNENQVPILDALRFASRPENTITPNDDLLICSDDRLTKTEGGIPQFGGSGGLVLGLLAINKHAGLGLSVEQMVDATVNASPGVFHFHSDEITEAPDSPDYGIGCKHLMLAMMPVNAEKYGVDPEEVIRAVSYMRKLADKRPDKVEMGIAKDAHRAGAILINMGGRKLNHRDPDRQYYVIAEARGNKYFRRFYPHLLEELPQLKEKRIGLEEFRKALNIQRDVTSHMLAEGLPIFEINADNPKLPFIKKAGFIE